MTDAPSATAPQQQAVLKPPSQMAAEELQALTEFDRGGAEDSL